MQKNMKIGRYTFPLGHTYIMGILNVTPDSFSDGGSYHSIDDALFRVSRMIDEGADMIDVGGESTRPGYTQISDQEENERVAPVIEAIKQRFDIPVSVDTYKSGVAEIAIQSGADMVNDIWGFKYDRKMAEIVHKYDVSCCLMHNRETALYDDFISELLSDLRESIALAKAAHIEDEKIILDPGVGFAKSYEQNLQVIGQLTRINELGYPVLLGTSRKSCIGLTLNVPVDERVYGTIATSVMAVYQKMAFVRVHDIRANAEAIRMTEAILNR